MKRFMKHNQNTMEAACKLPLLFLLLVSGISFLSSCQNKASQSNRFELIGGDPKIDFIEFYTEDSCMFVTPGPMLMRQNFSVDSAGYYTIHIIDNVYCHMFQVSQDTLVGEPPFFEGTWVRK